jgi:hypothetical protein
LDIGSNTGTSPGNCLSTPASPVLTARGRSKDQALRIGCNVEKADYAGNVIIFVIVCNDVKKFHNGNNIPFLNLDLNDFPVACQK